MVRIKFVTRSTQFKHYEVVRQIWIGDSIIHEQVVLTTDDFQACRSIANMLEENDKTASMYNTRDLRPTHASEDEG